MSEDKPAYKVPTMREIADLPWNGYKVASTFSGGGGSCTGYRMAGYDVVYANEFIASARDTYKANNPNSFLDSRDIREVSAKSILDAVNLEVGELDLFDGSPPCSAFSTAGAREKRVG
jgi:DNA (cytosine-5)-methyltransferase 1